MVSYLKKEIKIKILKRKKSWEPFRICLLNRTANTAQFWWKLAGLAVIFSRQIYFRNAQPFKNFLRKCLGKYKMQFKNKLTPLWQMLWKSEATLSYFEPQETSELVESLTLENSNFFWLGVTTTSSNLVTFIWVF